MADEKSLALNNRILISTIAPVSGGVPTMTRFVVDTLRKRSLEPVLGHYQPYSVNPRHSVPFYSLGVKRPGTHCGTAFDDVESHAIGAWLPELEFTHYAPTPHWRRLIDSCGAHLMIAGNILPATHYMRLGLPFMAWVATGWKEDRAERVAHFPWHRKFLDNLLNSPVLARLERRILSTGTVLALSQHTKNVLDEIAAQSACRDILPMPVDITEFSPDPKAVQPFLIGFTGRIDDPRKNIELLLKALVQLKASQPEIKAKLIGGEPTTEQKRQVEHLGLSGAVEFLPYQPRERLIDELRRLDVFVLPSHQEGLCISALEAMACGCPVVSTRCGGPEEFVLDDQTGYLTGFDATALAAAIQSVISQRSTRDRLSAGARELVENRYSKKRAESIFWDGFNHCFPAFRDRTS